MLTTLKPDALLNDLAAYLNDNPDSRIEKLHLYPLGGLRKSIEWINEIEPAVADDDRINAA